VWQSEGMGADTQQEAIDLIQDVNGIKASTRTRLLDAEWQWLIIWSLVFFGAALTALVPAWASVAGVYWMFAVPVAMVLTFLVSWRAERELPVRRRGTPYWLIGLGLTVSGFAASALLTEAALVVAVWVILGSGFAGLAWLSRLHGAAHLLAFMAVLSGVLGFIVEDTYQLYPMLGLAFSVALAGIAVGIRVQANG
jgi:hypothetical protein